MTWNGFSWDIEAGLFSQIKVLLYVFWQNCYWRYSSIYTVKFNNILFGVISCNLWVIFHHPVTCKTVKYIDQSDKISWHLILCLYLQIRNYKKKWYNKHLILIRSRMTWIEVISWKMVYVRNGGPMHCLSYLINICTN